MITVEGAKLLAQFIPIVILVMAVERHRLGPEPEPVSVPGWVWYWMKGLGQAVAVVGCISSLVPLFSAVNENRNIEGIQTVGILASVYLLGLAVTGVIVSLVLRSYFGHQQVKTLEESKRARDVAALELRRVRRLRRKAERLVVQRRKGRGGTPRSVTSGPRQ